MKRFLVNAFIGLPTFFSSPLYDLARRRIFPDEREITWRKVFAHVAGSRIKGDYLEFGVYRGTSFISAFKHAREHRLKDMRGSLHTTRLRGCLTTRENPSVLATLKIPEVLFRRIIEKAGVDLGRCEIVPGFSRQVMEVYPEFLRSLWASRRHVLE